MIRIYIEIESGKFKQVLKKIHNHNIVITSANKKFGEVYLNTNVTNERSQKFKTIKNILQKMRGVKTIKIIKPHIKINNIKLEHAFATNNCRFILDIDSTLTRSGSSTINSSVRSTLKNIVDRGIWVYVATGRSLSNLTNLIVQYNDLIQPHSIAENGGLILGFTSNGYVEWGNKDEPRKVLEYLQSKHRIKEDMSQGERITEVIFLHDDVSRVMLDKAIKATKAKVDIHKSQNSYHISAKNKDKGTAILELANRMKWGDTYKIAVGDSQLDVPMFSACDYSFAPKNCDKHARDACNQVLSGSYEECLAEIYELIVETN